MPYYSYIPIVLLFIMLYILYKQQQFHFISKKIARKKSGGIRMNEIINKFIGKECLITTYNSSLEGVIESIDGNWICVKNKDNEEIVNIDFISRIKPVPLKANGKKKSIY